MEVLVEYLAKGFLIMLAISMPCVLVAAGIGLVVGILARMGFMETFPKSFVCALGGGMAAVCISTPLNIVFWGGTTGNVWGDAVFAATQASGMAVGIGSFLDEIVVDVPDKILTIIIVYLILKGLPKKLTALYDVNAEVERLD